MINKNLLEKILFEPLSLDVNQLFIVSGYATPNMASWYMKNIQDYLKENLDKMHISTYINSMSINLIVGMVPLDGLSISVHEGFKDLVKEQLPKPIDLFECSYIFQNQPVHSKVYIWAKNDVPVIAFSGSLNFTQAGFSTSRRETATQCDARQAKNYYDSLIDDTIYCNHAEVEEYMRLYPSHPILDMENKPKENLIDSDVENVTLPLLARDGETGKTSGINWGQRSGRNPNQAYIKLPASISRSGFFPLNKKHFTVITDDGHQLILRVEQDGNKAITTPLCNADIGEYLRNRLGLSNGAYVWKKDLKNYGRTDITFYKLDEEQFIMDFSVNK